jgi:hypothetical protein
MPTLMRIIFLILLVVLVAFYAWFTVRGDNRLSSVAFLPRPPMVFFDLNPLARNFPAFAVLGVLLAAVVVGLGPKWQVLSLALCLAAPVLKDMAQIPLAGRHFNWSAVWLGLLGAAIGWSLCWAVGRWIVERTSNS